MKSLEEDFDVCMCAYTFLPLNITKQINIHLYKIDMYKENAKEIVRLCQCLFAMTILDDRFYVTNISVKRECCFNPYYI